MSLLAFPALTLTVDPLTAALGFAHLQVEVAPAPRWSLYLSPSLRLYDGLLTGDAARLRGVGVEAGLRWFFTPSAPEGGWLMARGVGAGVHAAGDPGWNPGGYASALAGYTAILGPGLVLAGGAGISWFNYDTPELDGLRGPLLALHTNIGWAFRAGGR